MIGRISASHPARRLGIVLAFLLCGSGLFAQSPLPEPSSAKPLFQEKPFGPHPEATATPPIKAIDPEDEKPIPRSWYLGGACAAAVAIAALLYGAARAWRSSNLFDRQYFFPVGAEASVRLGAVRCGGHMATINFDPANSRTRLDSKDS